LHFGERPQAVLSLLSTGFYAGLLATGLQHDLNALYFAGSTGAYAHLLWQVWTANINDRMNLWMRFQANQYTGAAVVAAILLGHL
jgi:4-hydroxybenzoate polyprenyltransferase